MDKIALPPALIALTAQGLRLAEQSLPFLPEGTDIHGLEPRCQGAPILFQDTLSHIVSVFLSGRPIIGICSTAILIRAVAPYLSGKHEAPPIIALSEDGKTVIPLLGSHHGGSEIAVNLAGHLQAHLGVTTAGDIRLPVQLDMPPAGYRLSSDCDVKLAMASLLADGGAAYEARGYPKMEEWLAPLVDGNSVRISVTTSSVSPESNHLVYHPGQLVLGVGFARGYSADDAEKHRLQSKSAFEIKWSAREQNET